jgi:hypothetical protein
MQTCIEQTNMPFFQRRGPLSPNFALQAVETGFVFKSPILSNGPFPTPARTGQVSYSYKHFPYPSLQLIARVRNFELHPLNRTHAYAA